MEVFALLMIENNYDIWNAMINYTFKEGNKPVFNFRAKFSETQKKTKIPGLEYIYLDQQPVFETKWTKANSGQAKLQGISEEGLNTFIKYRDRCLEGRQHTRSIPVEREVLAEVRRQERITQRTHEEWLVEYGRSNKRLSTASVPKEVKNLQVWAESSNEDDDADIIGV